jgi:hypothetical protein
MHRVSIYCTSALDKNIFVMSVQHFRLGSSEVRVKEILVAAKYV